MQFNCSRVLQQLSEKIAELKKKCRHLDGDIGQNEKGPVKIGLRLRIKWK